MQHYHLKQSLLGVEKAPTLGLLRRLTHLVQHYHLKQHRERKMLDINIFWDYKGHDPEIIRESQWRRFASVELVDEVIGLNKRMATT